MIIYEVTAIVPSDLIPEYEQYMTDRHIPDLMKTGCFNGAIFSKGEGGRYRIQYMARDEEHLNRYLNGDAQTLRADLASHFPQGIELSREIWSVKYSSEGKAA
jgi:uncharacterized protein DUF4286